VVIIAHENSIVTVYAHNESNLVVEEQQVKQGQVIATLGNTGNTSFNHLHFEYRLSGVARNPRELLPTFPTVITMDR
jgi:lysostaphin